MIPLAADAKQPIPILRLKEKDTIDPVNHFDTRDDSATDRLSLPSLF